MFKVDSRIQDSCIDLVEWPLSQVYFKKDANFPWAILVPRVENTQEIYQLSPNKQHLLMDEIAALSQRMSTYFKAEKINVGALGNLVAQLHIHVVVRQQNDKAWPHGIWQSGLVASEYSQTRLEQIAQALGKGLSAVFNE